MRYGVPYTGSKNGIAKWVIDNLPRAKNLIDVFAGGMCYHSRGDAEWQV